MRSMRAPLSPALDQGYINHIAFVLDESGSMGMLTDQVVQVADNQIRHLAATSQNMDQETRATVYTFNFSPRCVFYDKDVLRLPSLKNRYRPSGQTALVAATLQAIGDLEKTATLYGDHSFLIFVITDGQENLATSHEIQRLRDKLRSLPAEWTLAILVPDAMARAEALKLGFAPDNIQVWDTTAKGLQEVNERLERATTAYFQARSSGTGFRGTSNIFSLDATSVRTAVQQGALKELSKRDYEVYAVKPAFMGELKIYIQTFVERSTGKPYSQGSAFYQLTPLSKKPKEKVQANKTIAIREKKTGKVYVGDAARQMVGLPANQDHYLTAAELQSNDYDIFIQSTSSNRILYAGSDLLFMKRGV